MSTGLIITLIVVVVVVLALAAFLARRLSGPRRDDLRSRFGPEYDRTLDRHDGDARAAERELTARVEEHGELRERHLDPARRDLYEARWLTVQERFVDAPHEAVAEADRLLAEVAEAKGFPSGARFEEQAAALSVHHARQVGGYRRLHRAAAPADRAAHGRTDGRDDASGTGPGTEELRTALLEARDLFDVLVGDVPGHEDRAGRDDRAAADGGRGRHRSTHGAHRAASTGSHQPGTPTRRHAKGN
jgi:hypothetical protein